MATMNHRKWLRQRAENNLDPIAFDRRLLALRGRCRRHDLEYPLNVRQRGVVVANGCPRCRVSPR